LPRTDRSRLSRIVNHSGPEQAALPAIVAEVDLDGLRLSTSNDFAVTPPGEKYLGVEQFHVHLAGSADPDEVTHLTFRTIGGLW
jgi:hypothetical protein